MKHYDLAMIDPADVEKALALVGVACPIGGLTLIARHADAVLDENTRMNLTRVTERADVLRLHIADSAAAIRAFDGLYAGPLADIGSGAGYPGIVLHILTGRPVTLIESVKKKAAFLTRTSKELGLEVQVLGERAEDVGRERPQSFACVVARALSSLPALVELAEPLLMKHGRLIAMKGPLDASELMRGDQAAKICGMRRSGLDEFELSEGERRTIISYERVSSPRVSLPRRNGMAQRHPLA